MNRLIRMVLRRAMREGTRLGVDALARRRAEQIDPDTPGAREMQRQTRKQGQMAKRGLRLMRRFLRF